MSGICFKARNSYEPDWQIALGAWARGIAVSSKIAPKWIWCIWQLTAKVLVSSLAFPVSVEVVVCLFRYNIMTSIRDILVESSSPGGGPFVLLYVVCANHPRGRPFLRPRAETASFYPY